MRIRNNLIEAGQVVDTAELLGYENLTNSVRTTISAQRVYSFCCALTQYEYTTRRLIRQTTTYIDLVAPPVSLKRATSILVQTTYLNFVYLHE